MSDPGLVYMDKGWRDGRAGLWDPPENLAWRVDYESGWGYGNRQRLRAR